jgi:hypothetical protein
VQLHLVVVPPTQGVGHWGGAMLALALHQVGLAGGGCCCGLSVPGISKATAMLGDMACLGL